MTNTSRLYYQSIITKALLTSIGNTSLEVDITNLILEYQFSESLFNNTIHGRLVFADGIGLMNSERLTITGEEFLTIAFETGEDKSFEYKFVVTNVQAEVRNSSSDASVVALTLMSVDGFSNLFTFISKGYGAARSVEQSNTAPTASTQQRQAKNITDIVKEILQTELKTEVSIDDTKFTPTENNYYFGFTRIRPFEKIEILKQKAFQQTDYLSSTFVFYEDRSGYNFKSIENIIDLSASNNTPLTYIYSQLGSYLGFTEPNTRFIRSYEPATRVHNYQRLQSGFYKTTLLRFDIWTKRILTDQFNAYQDYTRFAHMQGSIGGTQQVPQEQIGQYTLNVSRQFAEKVNNVSDYTLLIPYDSEADDLAYKNILYSKPFLQLLSENTLNIVIDGTLELELGDPIIIEIPDNRPANSSERELDSRYSGRYFIIAITHTIDNNEQTGLGHRCSVTVTRDLLPISQAIYDQQVSSSIDIPTLESE